MYALSLSRLIRSCKLWVLGLLVARETTLRTAFETTYGTVVKMHTKDEREEMNMKLTIRTDIDLWRLCGDANNDGG